MSSAPASRGRIVEAATAQMLAKGYAAARVEEICAAAGVSKGSFYHSFRTKEDVGRAVLDEFFRRASRLLLTGPDTEAADPARRLAAFLDHVEDVAEEIWGDGCVLGGFATSLADTNPELADEVSRMFSKLTIALAPRFEAIDAGGPTVGAPTALERAEQFLVAVEGGVVLARAHGDRGRLHQALSLFRRELERAMPTASPLAERTA